MARRYIYTSKTAYKIRIPTPDGKGIFRSVGFVRSGKREALKRATKLRNTLGKEVWHEHWDLVLKTPDLLANLPFTIEPTLYDQPTGDNTSIPVYRVMWGEYDPKLGRSKRVLRQYSLNKHGKLGAYLKAKKAIYDAHKEVYGLLIFMGRAKPVKFE
ncbi:Fe3+-citrate ABC transporter substrate-binding protein [Vibrio parahaemolyticus]|nr:Fe3+-citrate ABC transporter substrate-binding protein [Vibrio parahaemolyticus]